MSYWKRIDVAIRRWLCSKDGHQFWVGASGHYCGMSQNRCWRCGKKKDTRENKSLPEYEEPLGRWFS